ncbi:MAG: hypothetical protein ERJ69_06545, partial [Aphanocapsa feldmannii 288cV]
MDLASVGNGGSILESFQPDSWFWGCDATNHALATDFWAPIPGAPAAGDSFDIQRYGGRVAAVATLVNAGRLKPLRPEARVVNRLRARFPDAIRNTFEIDPGALTANEASYLHGFRTADQLRNRAVKAAEEIHLR